MPHLHFHVFSERCKSMTGKKVGWGKAIYGSPVSPDVYFNKQDHLIFGMKRDVLDLHNPTLRSIACLILMEQNNLLDCLRLRPHLLKQKGFPIKML